MAAPLLELLGEWLPHQRWYPRKGSFGARLSIAGSFELPSPNPNITLLVLLLEVDFPALFQDKHDAEPSLTLQIPLSIHLYGTNVSTRLALDSAGAAEIRPSVRGPNIGELAPEGQWSGGQVRDGLADPVFMQAWLAVLADGGPTVEGLRLWRSPNSGMAGAGRASGIRLVVSEQSNSSVIFNMGGRAMIAKFFRVVHAGVHPEVEIGKALGRPDQQGFGVKVPALQAVASWGAGNTTLVVVHDFIAGARDGWDVALAAAGSGSDFSLNARAIGVELAKVHASLRRSLAVQPVRGDAVVPFTQAVSARLEWAWELAGTAVGPYDEQLKEVVAQLNQIKSLPPLQRIHGDLHLGQLLFRESAPGQGWYILDFEGEPLRPLADRGAPDVVLRDLAGMLRSFDYAAAQATTSSKQAAPGAALWVQNCAAAFLEGYESVIQERVSRTDPLFVALWLDKALYEVVYELQNRPSWVWVPVNAVRELFRSRESGVTWH
ncbi:hypothetical protein ART_3330 [Arthrobacter sp. PAMC 25486]|uniref:maltokinase N-terminal cap-like domain-containing protein n=1 Tax=Arthrobacter sp. PAMC 25486 TaxID=1494608 RepID=UPI0005361845|nr:hypothetical protein ART_3330 [Arthrobacter sp. PAMC 25486]